MKMADTFKLKEYCNYLEFINECRNKNYDESLVLHKHHIIPIHMCADSELVDSVRNIVKLSVDDHVKAHLLLSEMYEVGTYEYSSNLKSARILNRKSIKDSYTLKKISKAYESVNNPFYGKTHTDEVREKLKESGYMFKNISYEERYGRRCDIEKEKRSKGVKKYFESATDEWKKRRSENLSKSLKGKFSGGKNPNAKKIMVNGITYESVSDARRILGVSRYKLFKHYNVKKINETN